MAASSLGEAVVVWDRYGHTPRLSQYLVPELWEVGGEAASALRPLVWDLRPSDGSNESGSNESGSVFM